MNKCFHSIKYKRIRWMNNIIAFVSGLICVVLGIVLFDSDVDTQMPCTFLICIGTLIWVYGVVLWLYFSREYDITCKGISIRYLKKWTCFFPWSQNTEVMLCSIFRSNNGYMQDDVIWISLQSVKNGPPDRNRKYNDLAYHLLCLNTVLTFEITDERLLEIKKVYKRPIPDYRMR